MKIPVLLLCLLFSFVTLRSQTVTFTVIDTLPEGAYGTAVWGDFDNDGFKDLAYLSQVLPNAAHIIYHNVNNVFTPVAQHFPYLYNPAACWGDLNNDGFDDLVVCGLDSSFCDTTFIYQSMGNGTFVSVPHSIPGMTAGSVDLADYNNDGLKDIAITGIGNPGHLAYIYKNMGGMVFNDIQVNITGIHFGELKWGDYDNDGLKDLAVTGQAGNDVYLRLYHNMGNDTFELEPFLLGGGIGTVDFIDYDNDGLQDLLVSGIDSSFVFVSTFLYHNEGNRVFTEAMTNLPGFGEPSAATVADFNGDSITDICMIGGTAAFVNYSMIAYGDGTANFAQEESIRPDISNLFTDAADIDNDGDIDLVVSQYILRNDGLVSSVGPQPGKPGFVSVYPNPANGVFSIDADPKFNALSIYDVAGRMVMESFDRNDWNNIRFDRDGFWIVVLRGDDGEVVRTTVVNR